LVVVPAAGSASDVTTGVGGITGRVDGVDAGWPAVEDLVAVLGEVAGSNSRSLQANVLNRARDCAGAAGVVVPARPLYAAASAFVATATKVELTSAAGTVAATGVSTGVASGTIGAGGSAFVTAAVVAAFSVAPEVTVSATAVDAPSTCTARVAAAVERLCSTGFGAGCRTRKANGASLPVSPDDPGLADPSLSA